MLVFFLFRSWRCSPVMEFPIAFPFLPDVSRLFRERNNAVSLMAPRETFLWSRGVRFREKEKLSKDIDPRQRTPFWTEYNLLVRGAIDSASKVHCYVYYWSEAEARSSLHLCKSATHCQRRMPRIYRDVHCLSR